MTTTRKGFFTALATIATAGIARAQSTIITPCRPKLQWAGQTPLCNGQCPQGDCGYRAPEFPKRNLTWEEHREYAKPGQIYWDSGDSGRELIPLARLNRCPNCNTAFWQDPTEEKG